MADFGYNLPHTRHFIPSEKSELATVHSQYGRVRTRRGYWGESFVQEGATGEPGGCGEIRNGGFPRARSYLPRPYRDLIGRGVCRAGVSTCTSECVLRHTSGPVAVASSGLAPQPLWIRCSPA